MGVDQSQLIKVAGQSKESRIAVIFVHGLGGDPVDTWRKDEQSKTLYELLGQDAAMANSELYSFGYRTGFKPWQYDFTTVAKLLYTDIQATLPGRDIVFVAHSMGGLVVQQYIVDRYESFDNINLRTIRGVVNLSVPFRGSGLAELFPKWLANSQLRSLKRRNPLLARLEENWNKYVYRGGTDALPESLKHTIPQISLRGERDRIVAGFSSSPLYLGGDIFAVDEDHSSICKVADENSTTYKTIRNFLHKQIESLLPIKSEAMVLHIHGYDKQ